MNDFIELHERSSGKPIIVRVRAISCVRSDTICSYPVTLLTIGEKEYKVAESYEEIKNMILAQPMIKWEYKEEDKERIKELLEEWNKIGCTTFSSSGMTDDEWHRAIAGLSDD